MTRFSSPPPSKYSKVAPFTEPASSSKSKSDQMLLINAALFLIVSEMKALPNLLVIPVVNSSTRTPIPFLVSTGSPIASADKQAESQTDSNADVDAHGNFCGLKLPDCGRNVEGRREVASLDRLTFNANVERKL